MSFFNYAGYEVCIRGNYYYVYYYDSGMEQLVNVKGNMNKVHVLCITFNGHVLIITECRSTFGHYNV